MFEYEENRIHVTITVGVALYEENLTNDAWISIADERLYCGKENGKNQVV